MRLPKGLSVVTAGHLKIAKLYDTNIVQVNDTTKHITLSSGGWKTKHTKKCMNLVLQPYGYKVIQKAFQWYVVSDDKDLNGDTCQAEYIDGIALSI